MLLQHPNVRVWLYTQPTDMRKQFDGLAALAKNQMNADLVEGQLFIFINRKRTQLKALYYSKGGLCLWSKRLERGLFHRIRSQDDPNTAGKIALSWTQLHCLIDGINWQKAAKYKRY